MTEEPETFCLIGDFVYPVFKRGKYFVIEGNGKRILAKPTLFEKLNLKTSDGLIIKV